MSTMSQTVPPTTAAGQQASVGSPQVNPATTQEMITFINAKGQLVQVIVL